MGYIGEPEEQSEIILDPLDEPGEIPAEQPEIPEPAPA
jgi:hypothetical protein